MDIALILKELLRQIAHLFLLSGAWSSCRWRGRIELHSLTSILIYLIIFVPTAFYVDSASACGITLSVAEDFKVRLRMQSGCLQRTRNVFFNGFSLTETSIVLTMQSCVIERDGLTPLDVASLNECGSFGPSSQLTNGIFNEVRNRNTC